MNWLTYALLSVAFFTILNVCSKLFTFNSKHQRAFSFLFNASAAVFSLLIFLAGRNTISVEQVNSPAVFILLAACCLYAVFERLRFTVIKNLAVTTTAILSTLASVTALSVAFFLYDEILSLQKVIGSILILGSVFLVSYKASDGKQKASPKYVLLGIFTFSCLGFAWSIDKIGALYWEAETYNILVWSVPLFFIFLPRIKYSELKHEATQAYWRIPLLALLNVCGYYFQLKALSLGDATIVIPMVQTSIIFTVFLGIIVFNEREKLVLKLFSGALAVLGTLMLV